MRLRHSTLLPALLLALALCALAQQPAPEITVPRVIRYTATLPNGAQDGATGAIFSIYRDQYEGTPLWSEVQNVRTDERGSYNALLGVTRNEGLPIDLFSTSEPRWLEVEVAGVKQPRVLLGSVPYAMVAEDARTLGGLPPSAYLRVDGAASGSNSSTNKTVANVAAPTGGVRALLTSGTPGYLALFTNGTDLGNSVLFQNGNTISIGGTTSLGAMTLNANVPSGDAAGMALFNSGGGGGSSVSLDMYNTYANGGIPQAKIKAIDDGAFSDHLTFWTKTPGAAGNPVVERMRITSTGNVDIPGSLLKSGSLFLQNVGDGNTALGIGAMPPGTNEFSTALGYYALGSGNASFSTAVGTLALSTGTGVGNTAVGYQSGTGGNVANYNISIGIGAGTQLSQLPGRFSGSDNNIIIGAFPPPPLGMAGTSQGTTVIGGSRQNQVFISGIRSVQTGNSDAVPVVIDSKGQLGTINSSARFKEDIQDMAGASSDLMRLRPVTYRYKQSYLDGSKPIDYGLIAEEVAEVYPDLVARNQDGQIQTVMYQKLTPMLLNEVQKLNGELAAERQKSKSLEQRMNQLEELVKSIGVDRH